MTDDQDTQSQPNPVGADFISELTIGSLTWSYRRMLCDNGEQQVREVYVRSDGTVAGWVDRPATLCAEDDAGLRAEYDRMARAFTEPVLVETELPGYQPQH